MKEKIAKFEKYTSKYIFVLAFAITAGLTWLSLSFTSEASSDTLLSVPVRDSVVKYSLGNSNSTNYRDFNELNIDVPVAILDKQITIQSDPLVLRYDSFEYSFEMGGCKYTGSTFYSITDDTNLDYDLGLYLRVGRRGSSDYEYYPLNTSGGYITIPNSSSIWTFHLSLKGDLNGRAVFSTTNIYYLAFNFHITAFDFRVFDNTITDSEGTVWTVPEGVENPVVIRLNDTQKFLLDAVEGLGYFQNPLPSYSDKYVLGAEEYINVILYDYDLVEHKALLRESYAEDLGLEPVFCTNLFWFYEFLYGSLPQLAVTPLNPVPSEPPTPTETPVPDNPFSDSDDFNQLRDLGTLRIGSDSSQGYVSEGDVLVQGGFLRFRTKVAEFSNNASGSSTQYIRTATIEDYCPKYVGRFDLDVQVDGYISMSFPDIWLFPNLVYPEDIIRSWDQFPTDYDSIETGLLSEYFDAVIVLHANGQRYYVNQYGGNVQIPVNTGNNVILLEIGLQVKDDFIANHGGYIQAVYEAYLDDFTINIREYKDPATSGMEQIKDLLENFPGSDQMDKDKSDLDSAIKDYGDVEDSIFESTGEGIGNFDITTGFEFNGSILSAIGFLSVIISNLILAMGDYSILYTVGACLVFACILLGLFKYFVGGGSD